MNAQAQPVLVINDPAKVAEYLYKLQKPDFDAMLLRVESRLTEADRLKNYPGAYLSLKDIKQILNKKSDLTAKKKLAEKGLKPIEGTRDYDKEEFRKAFFGK